jgi:hypothetical protein
MPNIPLLGKKDPPMSDQLPDVAEHGYATSPAGGRTRPFVSADVPQVVDLYLKVFPHGHQYSLNRLSARFRRVLLENPWYDPSISSQVYERDGKVCGFLGVVVRPMLLGSEIIHVATSNHFMVDASARRSMAGLELMSHLFAGPQDLTIAEAGDDSRKLWEALGGRTSFARSLFWTRVLRPAQYALYQLRKRGMRRDLSWLLRLPCGVFDALALRSRHSPLYQSPPDPGEEASEQALVACLSQVKKRNALFPLYDEYSLKWLLGVLSEKKLLGTLRKVLVHGKQREIVGWYIYYLNPKRISTVLHLSALPGYLDEVFRHVCHEAWRQGSIALTGRVEPRYVKEFCQNHCFLHWRSWMLVHSRYPRILTAFDGGEAIFTGLEGEWWISVEDELPEQPET